jgi:hypothetical protein
MLRGIFRDFVLTSGSDRAVHDTGILYALSNGPRPELARA